MKPVLKSRNEAIFNTKRKECVMHLQDVTDFVQLIAKMRLQGISPL